MKGKTVGWPLLCAGLCAIFLVGALTLYFKGQQEIQSLHEQIIHLENQLETAAVPVVQSGQTQEEELLADSLAQHPELIPIEAKLGGTMRFYPQLTKKLNEGYVYAYGEDGHVAVDMLFHYQGQPEESLEWTLVAYDDGGGWRMAA